MWVDDETVQSVGTQVLAGDQDDAAIAERLGLPLAVVDAAFEALRRAGGSLVTKPPGTPPRLTATPVARARLERVVRNFV